MRIFVSLCAACLMAGAAWAQQDNPDNPHSTMNKDKQGTDGSWEDEVLGNLVGLKGGTTALAALALLEAGTPAKDPAVTPAPKPTTSTERGFGLRSAGTCPIMRSRRISRGAVDASALPLT